MAFREQLHLQKHLLRLISNTFEDEEQFSACSRVDTEGEGRESSTIPSEGSHPQGTVAGEFQVEQREVQSMAEDETLVKVLRGWVERKGGNDYHWSEPPHKMFYAFTVLSLIYSLIFINITLQAFIIALCTLRYTNCQEPNPAFQEEISPSTPCDGPGL